MAIKKRGWDICIKTNVHMNIRKTGIARWRGSGFSLRTLKKENDVFCPSLFLIKAFNNFVVASDTVTNKSICLVLGTPLYKSNALDMLTGQYLVDDICLRMHSS